MIIYLIQALEACGTGLTGISFSLYLSLVLKMSSAAAGWVFTIHGIVFTLTVLLLGRFVDKLGFRTTLIFGSIILTISRLSLASISNLYLAIPCFMLAIVGNSIKNSSIITAIKLRGQNFQWSYLSANIGFCLAGIILDWLKGSTPNEATVIQSIVLAYLVAGVLSLINVGLSWLLEPLKAVSSEATEKNIDKDVLKKVLLFTTIMLFCNSTFLFWNMIFPKLLYQVFGAGAPIGKTYGTLNPILIIAFLPVIGWIRKKWNIEPLKMVIFGSIIASLSFFLTVLPIDFYSSIIFCIIINSIGESIFSSAAVETQSKMIPTGKEGQYLSYALLPSMLNKLLVGPIISSIYDTYVHSAPYVLFCVIGGIGLITPLLLLILWKKFVINASSLNP